MDIHLITCHPKHPPYTTNKQHKNTTTTTKINQPSSSPLYQQTFGDGIWSAGLLGEPQLRSKQHESNLMRNTFPNLLSRIWRWQLMCTSLLSRERPQRQTKRQREKRKKNRTGYAKLECYLRIAYPTLFYFLFSSLFFASICPYLCLEEGFVCWAAVRVSPPWDTYRSCVDSSSPPQEYKAMLSKADLQRGDTKHTGMIQSDVYHKHNWV